jgi:hypothetical protein
LEIPAAPVTMHRTPRQGNRQLFKFLEPLKQEAAPLGIAFSFVRKDASEVVKFGGHFVEVGGIPEIEKCVFRWNVTSCRRFPVSPKRLDHSMENLKLGHRPLLAKPGLQLRISLERFPGNILWAGHPTIALTQEADEERPAIVDPS